MVKQISSIINNKNLIKRKKPIKTVNKKKLANIFRDRRDQLENIKKILINNQSVSGQQTAPPLSKINVKDKMEDDDDDDEDGDDDDEVKTNYDPNEINEKISTQKIISKFGQIDEKSINFFNGYNELVKNFSKTSGKKDYNTFLEKIYELLQNSNFIPEKIDDLKLIKKNIIPNLKSSEFSSLYTHHKSLEAYNNAIEKLTIKVNTELNKLDQNIKIDDDDDKPIDISVTNHKNINKIMKDVAIIVLGREKKKQNPTENDFKNNEYFQKFVKKKIGIKEWDKIQTFIAGFDFTELKKNKKIKNITDPYFFQNLKSRFIDELKKYNLQ